MLERMDTIEWSVLSHAYGPASDVPVTLRALLQGGISTEEAASEFWGNIWHQGTVYEATAPTVPFLIELLSAAGVRDKQWLLLLLAGLASSDSGRTSHRAASHTAVGQGIPAYVALLGAAEPQVRTTAAHALGQFPERGPEITPVLERALSTVTDADAETSLMLALESMGRLSPTLIAHMEHRLSPGTPHQVRLTAALILARQAGPGIPLPIIAALRDGLAQNQETPKAYVFSVWETDKELSEQICAAIWSVGEAFALPFFLGLLPEVGDTLAAYPVVDILLEKKFTQVRGQEKAASAGMTQEQRHILAALVDEPEIWRGNAVKALEWQYGLPADREALRSFLQKEAE